MDPRSLSFYPAPTDIPSAISQLKSLLSLASSALHSTPFPSIPGVHSPPLLSCPYNPHHLMPPESLYRHSLHCPSPLPSLPSISPPRSPSSTSHLPLSGSDSDSDFVFSLESELGDLGLNFYYKDCPGVVSALPDPIKSFTLPAFLLAECGNLTTGESSKPLKTVSNVLPSDYWVLKSEVESWGDLPVSYSYKVIRVLSGLNCVREMDLKKWVIANSPKFGIIIDVAMRDHIFLLLKVCLKAVLREANCNLEIVLSKDGELDLSSLSFECSKLVGSFSWLSDQLSFLYGMVNGRLFALGMIKESILQSGYCTMMRNFGEKKVENGINSENSVTENGNSVLQGVCHGQVFVSQLASAIAALYKRSFLEQKIKSHRSAQSISKSQLLMEYSYALSRGAEERAKRPNYRPILDYDGLPLNRVQDQESGRTKTKEELLAEERDYKRRRMSYRGKKAKRNPTEVLRDIIEEHMGEIKHFAGIESNSKFSIDNIESSHNTSTSSHIDELCDSSRSYNKSVVDRDSIHEEYRYEKDHKRPRHERGSSGYERGDPHRYSSKSREYRERLGSENRRKERDRDRLESVAQDAFRDRYDPTV